MPNLVKKNLEIASTTTQVESPGNSIRYNCQRSAANQEDLKPYWESEKKLISLGGQQSHYKLFKDFTNQR